MTKLREFVKKKPAYQRVVDMLADMLDDWGEIEVLPPNTMQVPKAVHALVDTQERWIWFKDEEPQTSTFAHEIIHLCKKPTKIHEEVYAQNLASFIGYMAEKNIKPICNPLLLFTLKLEEIEQVIKEVTGINGVDNFFMQVGILPSFLAPQPTPDGVTFVRNKTISDESVAVHTISEIIAGAMAEDGIWVKLIWKMMERCARK